ncbi:MAG TPA: AlkA N-terminal domain-containing protein [Arenimonas sp.]|nr:AlkA N-terminal domain-containing protein [Arenimonas sp.]HPO23635.1 AlkA N-terminal domain-containing protein [Arenimonas sp.]HPW33077.1 AlkA N-terminal domain-containing protein [Arenimonas sp.]
MNSMMPNHEICDRARMARDARFDGLFFIAVKSTGIYCRPVCPAPSPKPKNIVYYPNAAAASAAGFRPCLRCRPELSPNAMQHRYQDEWVNRALALIADGELQEGSVDTLAAKIGLSTRQIRRLFLSGLGATPIAVHTTRRLLLAKQLLTETSLPMTQIALASGFKSLRRFNAAFAEGCGMPPTAIRRLRTEAPSGSLSLRLAYRPPFDFSLMLAFLAKRAVPGIEHVTETSYERVLGPIDNSTWIRVTADPVKPELRLEISDTDPRMIHDIVQRTRRLFDLDADLQAVHQVLMNSDLLKTAIKRRPGLRVPGSWDGFELAVRAVLGQQISVAGATTLTRRLVEQYGEDRTVKREHLDRAFPKPEAMANAPLEKIGLPASRAATLRSMAQAVIDGRIDFRAGQHLDTFIREFTNLPGIGPWTAQYVAMRALRQPDAFPAGDLILQQVMGGDTRLSEKETEARSQAWRPWRAYSVLHLWHLSGDLAKEKKNVV